MNEKIEASGDGIKKSILENSIKSEDGWANVETITGKKIERLKISESGGYKIGDTFKVRDWYQKREKPIASLLEREWNILKNAQTAELIGFTFDKEDDRPQDQRSLRYIIRVDGDKIIIMNSDYFDDGINNLELQPSTEIRESIKEKLPKLLKAAENLQQNFNYNYGVGWYSGDDAEGNPTSNHWSGGLAEIKKIKGNLTDAELTIYSMSLDYGPRPLLSEEEDVFLSNLLWPTGNNTGSSMAPGNIAKKLSEVFE